MERLLHKLPWLRLPLLPPALGWAVFFYLSHLVTQGKIALLEISGGFAMVALIVAIQRAEAKFSFHILYYPLFVYGLISSVSSITAGRSTHFVGETMLWIKMAIFPTALILFRTVPRVRELAMPGQILFAVGMAAYGLSQYFLEKQRDLEHRITGSSTHVMTFSGILLPMSLLLLVLLLRRRSWPFLAATLVVSTALLLTFTRSVWIGWLAAVAVLLMLGRLRLLAYALPALVIFITLLPLPLFGRLMSTFDIEQSSNLDRIRMLQAGTEMIKDHPVLGVGPANVKPLYPLYRRPDAPRFRPPHLHNNLVQLWAERGVGAVVAYLMLLGLFLRICFKALRGPGRVYAEAGIAITVGLTVAGLFEFNFGDTEVFYLMLELFALVIAWIEVVDPRFAPAGSAVRANEPGPAVVGEEPGSGPSVVIPA